MMSTGCFLCCHLIPMFFSDHLSIYNHLIWIQQTDTLQKHAHMIYSNFFRSKVDNFQRKYFDIFLIFAQNRDCGYLGEAVLTSTHNLCFGAKIRKIGIPQFCYIKVGFKGVYLLRTCFPDELCVVARRIISPMII